MRFIETRVSRFLIAGAINTAATYGLYVLLLQVCSYRIAFTIAFASGILISYFLNARVVFRRPASLRSFLRFPLIYVFQYVLGLLLVAFCVESLGMARWSAPLVALVVTIPLTYVLSRSLLVGSEPS